VREDSSETELLLKARAGDGDCLDALTERVRPRVYAYINRLTLDEDLAQDLTQDTLLAVVSSLGKLEHVERFWPWVFRIATNRVRQHYRQASRHRTVSMPDEEVCVPAHAERSAGALTDLADDELASIARVALSGLSERHRAVLTLRFFNDLSHSEIAEVLECSELATRAALFRAKNAMAGAMKRRGINRSMFGAALAAFGHSTLAPQAGEAAVSISASALAESGIATLLSAKVKACATAAVLALMVLGFVWLSPSESSSAAPVRWVHFSRHSGHPVSDPIAGTYENQSQGVYEQWYYFPEGLDGPMLFRMQRWNPRGTKKLCWWVENGEANYYVHSGEEKIYIHNDHLTLGGGMVKPLPTDSPATAEFIRGVEGDNSSAMTNKPELSFRRDPNTGFVISHDDSRFPKVGEHHATYEYTDHDPRLFDAPTGMEVVDERDAMHKRGWTFFEVEGELEGRKIEGFGCLPLVYNASKNHSAWLRLAVAGQPALVDTGQVACRLDSAGKVVAAWPGGALFKGMARPWMGFHTLDTIRRDAAIERIWFSVEPIEDEKTTLLTLVDDRGPVHTMLKYTVNVPCDVLERIEIWRGPQGIFSERVGELVFRYDDQMRRAIDNAGRPDVTLSGAVRRDHPTVLWPLQLVQPGSSREISVQ